MQKEQILYIYIYIYIYILYIYICPIFHTEYHDEDDNEDKNERAANDKTLPEHDKEEWGQRRTSDEDDAVSSINYEDESTGKTRVNISVIPPCALPVTKNNCAKVLCFST